MRKPKCGKVKDIKPEQIAFDTIWNQEAADPLTPIGHGKRELITGECQTMKNTIGMDTIWNQEMPLAKHRRVPLA